MLYVYHVTLSVGRRISGKLNKINKKFATFGLAIVLL
jgi:hypothetical protein